MPVFLVASLIAHSLVILQSVQPATPSWSRAGSTVLKISIVKPLSEPQVKVRTVQVTTPAIKPAKPRTTAKTITQMIKPAIQQPVATTTLLIEHIPSQSHQLATSQRTDKQLFNSHLAHDKIGHALQQRLNADFIYPWLARKRGWEGNVMLSLRVEQNGQLRDIKISQTSGYKVLDNSALDSARKINFLPEAAGLLHGNTITLQIPVQFQLLDS